MAAPPPHSPPVPKRLKMSSTASDTDDVDPSAAAAAVDGGAPQPKPRYKRRKIAIFLAYCGAGYQGMQKNPGARTIEGDLEEALFLAGAVPSGDRGCPKRYDWARSARTDKGVSANGQVVSGRFYIDPPGFVERLNSALSPQIRIFGFKRATGSFNAKKFCDRRRYIYLLPVFALDPSAHPDRETVLASQSSGSELARCVECSERGRKVPGLMGRRGECVESVGNGVGVEINTDNSVGESTIAVEKEEAETTNKTANSLEESRASPEKVERSRASPEKVESETTADSIMVPNGDSMILITSEFHYGEKEKERFNTILKRYVGTHNFHNLTTRTKAEDPSAQRYIISFNANSIIRLDNIDFIKCEVVGQSFMLHQIRKMIGLAVAIMRNCAPESLMDVALRKDLNINVPTAPEVGLFLDECFFTSYNQKWQDSHEELSMESYAEQAEEFKIKHIYSHIAAMEHKEGAVALWLHSLNHRNYPDFNYHESNGERVDVEKVSNGEHATVENVSNVEHVVEDVSKIEHVEEDVQAEHLAD